METKSPLKSKTLWMALLVAVAAFIPGVGPWIAGNNEMFGIVVGGLFAALRAVTKGKLVIE